MTVQAIPAPPPPELSDLDLQVAVGATPWLAYNDGPYLAWVAIVEHVYGRPPTPYDDRQAVAVERFRSFAAPVTAAPGPVWAGLHTPEPLTATTELYLADLRHQLAQEEAAAYAQWEESQRRMHEAQTTLGLVPVPVGYAVDDPAPVVREPVPSPEVEAAARQRRRLPWSGRR